MQNYSFHSQLLLRIPASRFDPNINLGILKEAVKTKTFMEAVYLASPNLYHAATGVTDFSTKENTSIANSLAKYYVRSFSRSTPFGLFAGVGLVNWGSASGDIIVNESFNRHTRLDMNYLCALAQSLNSVEEIRANVLYLPNTSIYVLGDEIRYVEFKYEGTFREHQISSIKTNEYILDLLDFVQDGKNKQDLAAHFVSSEIDIDEATAFVEELIDAQLIVSELEPAITGYEFLEQILIVLLNIQTKTNSATIPPIIRCIQNIKGKLAEIDNNKVNDVNSYRQIIEQINQLGVSFDENKLFQTDRVLDIDNQQCILNQKYQDDIFEAIASLNTINQQTENANISDFAKRFYDRYEDEEVPLLHALDTETGIGYLSNKAGDFTPLVENITLPHDDGIGKNIIWKETQQNLFRVLQKANIEGTYQVSFSSFGFASTTALPNLCPSFSVMFRLIDDKQIFIESIGGSSAANLLGRFAHADKSIEDLVKEIADKEQSYNSDVIFAEIVHLPESRTGNILLRPAFRNFEIPFLAKSSLPKENQLLLKDIYVSIRYNKVVLKHKPTNKTIIPRLATAHNFTFNALPVYQFLCDVQTQYFQPGVGFNWGQISNEFVFLPRVVHNNVVLSPAMWQLKNEHIQEIKNLHTQESFTLWRNKIGIPDSFVIAEGDNELFIDAKNPFLVDIFKTTVKSKNAALLKEYLWSNNVMVKNNDKQAFANQFIATIIRTEAIYKKQETNPTQDAIKRNFSIGSEWAYFKLYCGAKSADNIISNGIKPFVEKAQQNNWIDNWFFIRYNDPNYHIRFRVHLTTIEHLQSIFGLVDQFLLPFEQENIIWKIQTDTYKRELERYGYNNIEHVEKLFNIDSVAYVDFLNSTEGDEREQTKWLWGMRAIDSLLNVFGYSLEMKKNLFETIKNSFAKEFAMDQALKSQLDKKYRASRNEIQRYIQDPHNELDVILEKRNIELLQPIKGILANINPEQLDTQLAHYIHMLINRLISSNQRLHELIIYDFMYRNYQSQIAQVKVTV